jgi:FkbM family methyltransferase
MHPSALVFKAASLSPRFTASAMKLVASHLPSSWVVNGIATRHNLRIPVRTKLNNGMTVWVLLADEVGEAIRRRGCNELETVKIVMSHLSKEAIFFDLGAHIGQYTLVASPLCRAVHSFEAVPETFDLLRRNVQVNGLANVFANPCAVSDSCGEVTIFEGDLSSIDRSSLRAPPCSSGKSFVVPSTSLDAYVTKHQAAPDLIKIDVEGAEIAVLRGASNLLRERHPTLIVEIDEVNQRRFGFTADDLVRELKGFGYSLSRIENEPGSELSYFNVLAIAPPDQDRGANKGARTTS